MLHMTNWQRLKLFRDGPFNFQGGLWFFSKKIFWFPMLLKKIFWFWWRKKNLIQSFCHITYFLLRATKKNILTLVLSENIFLNETKNHNPPLQVKWSVPYKFHWLVIDSGEGSFHSIGTYAPEISYWRALL